MDESVIDKEGIDFVYTVDGALKGINHMPRGKDITWKASIGAGIGMRFRGNIVGGTGYDWGGDLAHGVLAFGSEGVGIQTSFLTWGSNVSWKGTYTGVDYAYVRIASEYQFQEDYIERKAGRIFQAQWLGEGINPTTNFDIQPGNVLDVGDFEGGFETNFFSLWINAIRNYVTDIVAPAMSINGGSD